MIDTLVIMPIYNAEDTVLEAITSVKNQTYKNFKLVCYDDCSTDNTLDRVIECRDFFDFKILKNQKNLGTGATVSRAISIESFFGDYEYMTWVSADNILSNVFLEKHINKISSGCAITYSGWRSFDPNKRYSSFYPEEDLKKLKESYGLGPSFLFRKNLYEKVGPFHSLPGEDFSFAVNCALNNAKFGFIRESLVDYRIHENSVSGRIRAGQIKNLSTDNALSNAQKINNNNGILSYE